MKYKAVTLTREIVERKSFASKEEAVEYFEEKFLVRIMEGLEKEILSAEKSISNYQKAIEEKEQEIETAKKLGQTARSFIQEKEKKEASLKEKERLLEKLMEEKTNRKIFYKDTEGNLKELIFGERYQVMHLAGIYLERGQATYIEEKYFCIIDETDNREAYLNTLSDTVYQHFTTAGNGTETMIKKMSKEKRKILEEIKKSERRIKIA